MVFLFWFGAGFANLFFRRTLPMQRIASAVQKRAFIAMAAVVFLWMFLLNCLTPYIADDFTFAYAFDTGLRLQSLPQLLQSLAYHYYEWSGRVVVKFFAQGFTMFPKILFNLCNAAAYVGLALVIYRLACGRRTGRYDLVTFALILAALWEISPAFGQTNLWMCGACNYLWASLGCLAYLLPWRYYLQAPFAGGKRWAVGMALGGVLAGWLSENTSAGMLVCLVLCMAVLGFQRRKIPVWMWTGLAGSLVGFVILIAARGNYNRASVYGDYDSLLTRYAVRFFNCLNMLKDYAMPLLFLFVILFVLLCFQYKALGGGYEALIWPVILLLGGLGANFAMILSPDYYERSTHGPFTLLTAACAACLVLITGHTLRKALACAAACAGLVCAFHGLEAGYDIASYYVMYQTRDSILRADAAALGQDAPQAELVSYAIEPYTHWCAAYGLPDIREDSGDSIGLCRARWYGVGAITATETRTYPFPGHMNEAYAAGEAAALENETE